MDRSKPFRSPYKVDDQYIRQTDPEQAIESIMETYGDEIKRLVYTYMKNSADTDDVTQEIFVTIYQKIQTFQGKSSLRSWIYTIAINKCKDYLRSWQARNKRLREKLIQSSYTTRANETNPEDETISKSESNQLFHHVMNLPIKYREVIILFYFKELSTKEIADMLHVKEATIRTRLKRSREKLKKCLSDDKGGVRHG